MRQRRYQLSVGAKFSVMLLLLAVVIVVPWTRNMLVAGIRGGMSRVWQAAGGLGHTRGNTGVTVEQLRAMNEALGKQVSTLRAGLEAAESLRGIQDFLTSTNRQGVAAAIIGYSDDPGIKTFIISAGSEVGVQPGMAVVSSSGFFLGKVVTVRDRVATVRELRDTQATVLARVETEEKSQGVVRGQRGTSLRMTFLPKNDPLAIGDLVATAGTEELVPPGLPIGTISDMATRPGDVFQTVTIFSPLRLSEITAVAVIRPL